MPKITPFLWFDDQAEEAMNFYTSIFKNSRVGTISRYGEEGPGPKGTVMSATFRLDGQEFMALNGGPHFTFSPAISFFVNCETQEEVDELWEKLSEDRIQKSEFRMACEHASNSLLTSSSNWLNSEISPYARFLARIKWAFRAGAARSIHNASARALVQVIWSPDVRDQARHAFRSCAKLASRNASRSAGVCPSRSAS